MKKPLQPRKYINVFVRTDIALADQIVQVGHACLLAGASFQPNNKDFLKLYAVDNEDELLRIAGSLSDDCVMHEIFHEPANMDGIKLGFTSLATEPVQTLNLDNLKLWSYPTLGEFSKWFETINKIKQRRSQ